MEQASLRVGPKDIFLHLLGIITLYASAISLATLLFQHVNLHYPDVAGGYYYREGILSTIRFAVSTLIVVFPVYFWTTRRLRKLAEADPERRSFGIRKWLGYFTLFLAGAIAIGWLVAVINKFLEGDFTTAFLLKALIIFFVTGSTFFYYRAVTQGTENRSSVRVFGYVVALIVLASVVAAFFVVGSPTARRMEKEDAERVNDLRSIQYEIGNYYQNKHKLPPSLADLKGAFGDQATPKDPVTKQDYDYIPGEGTSFQLCANFATVSNLNGQSGTDLSVPVQPASYYGPTSESWDHAAGHQCFTRTLDADYFKTASAPVVK